MELQCFFVFQVCGFVCLFVFFFKNIFGYVCVCMCGFSCLVVLVVFVCLFVVCLNFDM